jgi:predicted phosphodiesterase
LRSDLFNLRLRHAILADIHANLEALTAVLKDAEANRVTHYACLGDIVGYNANPKECLDIIRGMGMPCVKGNHDEYCCIDIKMDGINPYAAKAMSWTRKQINTDDAIWLHELRYIHAVSNFTIVHATLDGPQRWGYVFDKLAAAASLTYQNTSVCFFGHTHVPVAFIKDQEVRGGTYTKFKIEPEKKYFINAGSVGQPRDGNPRAAYAIYDMEEGTVELRRVDYDITTTQEKIRRAGLPKRMGGDEGEASAQVTVPKKKPPGPKSGSDAKEIPKE